MESQSRRGEARRKLQRAVQSTACILAVDTQIAAGKKNAQQSRARPVAKVGITGHAMNCVGKACHRHAASLTTRNGQEDEERVWRDLVLV